jgi:S-adenosylmethionine-diacylglycerol 3-amino-3-carboxypropyl transferase
MPREDHIDRFNLSDVFEYMSADNYAGLLRKIAAAGAPGARLAYWNLLAERRRPEHMNDTLRSRPELADRLHQTDKAFFYARFVLEEVL